MAYVPNFENDIFISFAHIDDHDGWVKHFSVSLRTRLKQLGVTAVIWRDRKLRGTDVFSDEIFDQLKSTALLISIVSPSSVVSNWCQDERKKFEEFAELRGGLRIGNVLRAVKVVKTPLDNDAHRSLFGTLGFEFYARDAEDAEQFEEFDATSPEFKDKLNDLAIDLKRALDKMRSASGSDQTKEGRSQNPNVGGGSVESADGQIGSARETEHQVPAKRGSGSRSRRAMFFLGIGVFIVLIGAVAWTLVAIRKAVLATSVGISQAQTKTPGERPTTSNRDPAQNPGGDDIDPAAQVFIAEAVVDEQRRLGGYPIPTIRLGNQGTLSAENVVLWVNAGIFTKFDLATMELNGLNPNPVRQSIPSGQKLVDGQCPRCPLFYPKQGGWGLRLPLRIPAASRAEWIGRKSRLYIWGTICYSDSRPSSRMTRFCYQSETQMNEMESCDFGNAFEERACDVSNYSEPDRR